MAPALPIVAKLLMISMALSVMSCRMNTNLARKGTLDLSHVSRDKFRSLPLVGEWQFQIRNDPNNTVFLSWPKTWPENYGYGKYTLRVTLPALHANETVGLHFPLQISAVRYEVNGRIVAAFGTPGTSVETEIPGRNAKFVSIPYSPNLEISAYVSSYHHARGGTIRPILIGHEQALAEDRFSSQTMDALLTFTPIGFFLFYLGRWFLSRTPIDLSLTVASLALSVRKSFVDERSLERVLNVSYDLAMRIEYGSAFLHYYATAWFCIAYLSWKCRPLIWATLFATIPLFIPLLFSPKFFSSLLYLNQIMLSSIGVITLPYLARAAKYREKGASYILFGVGVQILAGAIDTTRGIFFHQFSGYLTPYASIFFIGMLSLASGRLEKRRMVKLREESERLIHSYQQLSKIIFPHQIEMIRGGMNLEETMPTQKQEGVVIAFDIVGSSRLHHPRLKEFLEASIHDCLDILSENYDSKAMASNGYRIKELGDGFLCSIGYPLANPTEESNSDLALKLSYRFIENLEDHVVHYGFNEPVYCGVGIAKGELQGYYPKTGTKEYDLFGRGIVLATRYEAMRKKIFAKATGHSIILQSEVYQSLSSSEQESFNSVCLSGNLKVRNDDGAQTLYYRLVHTSLKKIA
ncbi:adenylate/guanylate cyclase domain-containing protein [Pseudobacteriovorax antillogorgiicola]|uniref:Adenylate cyclase, class 3 n=2 Tax=Pseudobacteriovorax antillogorgiicola TaxID=1513793 RepID=A0A1Y6BZ56_9BACT|nr:adenylate/guanylate cyclase domain-containing protein [Pseudobacteriovorax antillogorgiicola]TCS51228.1 class 3 adenylate cyclase [Pseudobacteriovorax antillogorgiicola]SMF36912.1 Adenylate cyclase, class 3 [Pseudobacteriovorax antillogorgiicola]